MKPEVICTIDFNINQEIIYLNSKEADIQYALILTCKENTTSFMYQNMECNKVMFSKSEDIFYLYDKEIDINVPKTIINLLKSKQENKFILGYNLFINFIKPIE